jgi:hypothetical protein
MSEEEPKRRIKLVIGGSRGLNPTVEEIQHQVELEGWDVECLISGGARGVDLAGEKWAKAYNIPIKRSIPEWGKYGKRAGILRNMEMAKEADCGLLFWDGRSPGTRHMIDYMENTIKKTCKVIK